MAEGNAALKEHLAEVAQGQPVAQPPEHRQRYDTHRTALFGRLAADIGLDLIYSGDPP
jgi:hypothetical protein